MDKIRGFLGIRRMDRVPTEFIRELCGVMKGVGERIDKGVLKWFGLWREWRMIGLLRGFM